MLSLYRHVVRLDPILHAELRLSRRSDFRFAGTTNAIPLGAAEFAVAAAQFPIVFTTDREPIPVAVVGYQPRSNLFVGPEGSWRAGSYLPAYLRAYPFIFVETAPGDHHLGVDIEAPAVQAVEGDLLFDRGRPAPVLEEKLRFCALYRDKILRETLALTRALAAAGVLDETQATIRAEDGKAAVLDGFSVVTAERLEAVPNRTFLDWRRRGWLPLIYAHLQSMAMWQRLVDLAATERQATPNI